MLKLLHTLRHSLELLRRKGHAAAVNVLELAIVSGALVLFGDPLGIAAQLVGQEAPETLAFRNG